MAARAHGLRPPYPGYRNQPFTGDLPPPPINEADVRPAGMNPAYTQYAGAHGRMLAGVGEYISERTPHMNMTSAEAIQDYPNELNILQQADDVVGNGVFDPPGSHGNVHADDGIFQDHMSLPGYVARDKFYTPSEVRDASTDQPVMYVPGGAVAIDRAQRQAFQDTLLWQLPPGVNPWEPPSAPSQSIVQPRDAAWPVGQTESGDTAAARATKTFVMVAAAGLSIGMLAALVMPTKPKGKMTTNRRRRRRTRR